VAAQRRPDRRDLGRRRERGAEEVDCADAAEEAQHPCLAWSRAPGLISPPGADPLEVLAAAAAMAIAAAPHPELYPATT
jgi:hypothetical protein